MSTCASPLQNTMSQDMPVYTLQTLTIKSARMYICMYANMLRFACQLCMQVCMQPALVLGAASWKQTNINL